MIAWYFEIRSIFEGTYTERIVINFLELFMLVGPYFMLSVVINAVIRQYFMKKNFDYIVRYEFVNILLASLLGIVSPIPTYIAVPIGVSFLYAGFPFSAIVAFMIASPLMNPGIFVLTMSELGLQIALARVITTLVLSISGGYLANWLFKKPFEHISDTYKKRQIPTERPIFIEVWRSIRFFSRYFFIALCISAAVKAFVSPDLVNRLLGNSASVSIVAAIIIGVPFYSCGGAAIPFVEVLSEMGMNKGAVLAFFISGPSTKLETLYIYKSVFNGISVLSFYLFITLFGAFISGFIFFYI